MNRDPARKGVLGKGFVGAADTGRQGVAEAQNAAIGGRKPGSPNMGKGRFHRWMTLQPGGGEPARRHADQDQGGDPCSASPGERGAARYRMVLNDLDRRKFCWTCR